MRALYLFLAVLVAAPSAMAQWVYQADFPANASVITSSNHGIAVDGQGKVWIQSLSPVTRDSVSVDPSVVANSTAANCNQRTNKCRVTVIYVLNPDGTNVSFSPLNIVTLPGGVRDTLGGAVGRTSTGLRAWDFNSGRGLDSDYAGNVFATIGANTFVYKFNSQTGAVMDFVRTSQIDARGGTAPSVDRAGNMYISGVFPNDPIAIYDANLDYTGNVVARDRGFNRDVLAFPDGNTVIALNYSNKVSTIYQRRDEFSSYDSTRAAFTGMAIESATFHPTTGNIWASAGSPNDLPTGSYAPGRRYTANTWYEFTTAQVLTNASPVPRDSIKYDRPTDGRPRAIDFSLDGRTAYVGVFSQTTAGRGSVQRFLNTSIVAAEPGAIEGAANLSQNQPNPFTGATEIAYSLDRAAYTRLRVLDLTGREVATLVNGQQAAGDHRATFTPNGLAAGVYVYMLEVDGRAATRRMLHVRR